MTNNLRTPSSNPSIYPFTATFRGGGEAVVTGERTGRYDPWYFYEGYYVACNNNQVKCTWGKCGGFIMGRNGERQTDTVLDLML